MTRGKHQILIGDNRQTLPTIQPGTVQAAITSPPYFRLRSYLPKDHPGKSLEIGAETLIDDYIRALVDVFRLVRDCLHETGTLWVNLGDGYNSHPGQRKSTDKAGLKQQSNRGCHVDSANDPSLKPGDQMLIPHRFAFAMQADGWYLRDTIIWHKRSPMPSSVSGWRWMRCRVKVAVAKFTQKRGQPGRDCQNDGQRDVGSFSSDEGRTKWLPCPGCDNCNDNGGYVLRKGSWRCTTAFEYVFMFSKSRRYFCDGDAVQEEATYKAPGNKLHKGRDAYLNGDMTQRLKSGLADTGARETRNPRNVWSLSGEGTSLKHFAAYPTELVKRILLAATSAAGCCSACRMPYAPIVENERVPTRPGTNGKVGAMILNPDSPYWDHHGTIAGNRDPQRHCTSTRILGYRPTCACGADVIPQLVLDPFAGTGTTLQVATWYGRDAVGCELNEAFADMAETRIGEMPRCMIRERKPARKVKPVADGGLFAGCE